MAFLRVVVAFGLVAAAALLGLFSLFLLLYEGDGGDGRGDTYVDLGGRELDAQLVGVAGLAVTAALFLSAWLAVRRRAT